MDLTKLSNFGNFNLSVSPINDVYLYDKTSSPGLCPWKTFNDMSAIYGTDLAPFLLNNPENQSVKIATLPNGSYLSMKVKHKETAWTITGSNIYYNYREHRAKLYIYNENNSLIFINGSDSTSDIVFREYQIKSDGSVVAGKILLFMAEDTKNSLGYAKIFWEGMYNITDTVPKYLGSSFIVNGNSSLFNAIHGQAGEYDFDPWSNAGYSGIGGGGGTFNFESDTIALPSLPTVDAVSSGFLQLFCGGLSSILELSKYMWSASFFDSVVKITSNPIDIIMGLYMYPFIVPASNRKYIRAGNVITNVAMRVPDSQIIEIDCGNVDVPNFYGAYLDYEPFTKCDLFLPYCGTFPLSMDDIAGKTLIIKYRVDLLTGVCGAYVIIDESVKYNYTGTCAINIPISSRSFENVYNSIMGVVGSMIGGSSFGLPSVGSIAGAVTSGKNQIQHGGNCSGNAGYLGVQKPYLIFSVPNVAIPKGLNTYTGYPIFATYKLADLKGYTEVEEIHLENMGSATKEEISMIINKLEGGVIL